MQKYGVILTPWASGVRCDIMATSSCGPWGFTTAVGAFCYLLPFFIP